MTLPNEFEVDVTQADIDAGECGRAAYCPVAIATARALGKELPSKDPWAGCKGFVIVAPDGIFASWPDELYLPEGTGKDQLKTFVRAFDKKLPVQPFKFTARRP